MPDVHQGHLAPGFSTRTILARRRGRQRKALYRSELLTCPAERLTSLWATDAARDKAIVNTVTV